MSHERDDWSFQLLFHARPITPTVTGRLYRSFHYLYAADDLNCVWSVWPGAAVINDDQSWRFCIQRKSATFERELIFDLFMVAICHPVYWLFLFTPQPPDWSFICSLVSLRKHTQKAEAVGFPPCFALTKNVIYFPRLNHADPIYWLARCEGGEGVIASKYHTGTAAGLLIGSVKVTWFQLDWRSDFDSICCQECFFKKKKQKKKRPCFSLCGWSD